MEIPLRAIFISNNNLTDSRIAQVTDEDMVFFYSSVQNLTASVKTAHRPQISV